MPHSMMRLLGPDILKNKPKIWDLDEEGELHGVYRQNDVPHLWYAAGGMAEARYLSKFLVSNIGPRSVFW